MVRPMALSPSLAFDPSDPAFLEDPYPALARLREGARVFYDERRERWFVTRHEDVRACLRDKRLGRNFRHMLRPEEIGAPPLDPRWQAFWASERWSLLWLEPPDHTRIRKLVAAAFTPRSVEALREPARTLAHELLEPLAAGGPGWGSRSRRPAGWSFSTTTRSRTRSRSSAACSAFRSTGIATCSTGRTEWSRCASSTCP